MSGSDSDAVPEPGPQSAPQDSAGRAPTSDPTGDYGDGPALDGFALTLGVVAEDLSVARGTVSDLRGPVVSLSTIERLFLDRPTRPWAEESVADRATLVDRGWLTEAGELTASGRQINADLGNPIMRGQLVRNGLEPGVRSRGELIVGASVALAVLFGVDPISSGSGRHPRVRFELTPSSGVPLLLARWGRLGPAWSLPSTHAPIPLHTVVSRIEDDRVPLPAGADAPLSAMWAQPWVQWGFSTDDRSADLRFINAGDRGHFVIKMADDGRVHLVARPAQLVWGDLVMAFIPRARAEQLRGDADDGW